VDAGRLVERALRVPGAVPGGPVRIIATGKAARPMAAAARRVLGARIRAGLIVSTPSGGHPSGDDGSGGAGAPFSTIVGSHPTPTSQSEDAGRRALEIAASVEPDETLVILLSGGASSLMAVPAEGLTLEDKRATTDRLLRAGADIHALNTVRKHLSAIKGGWLAARARGACCAFAISDVVGDDLSVIGSGPSVADATTFEDALAVLRRFGGEEAYPPAVVARLRGTTAGRIETPKPGDTRLARAATTLIGGRRDAMDGAANEGASRGYHVVRIEEAVVGEARVSGPAHFRAATGRAASVGRPACIVSSGETTVRVLGEGRGGRNQEFVLACVAEAAALGGVAAASVGTDGIDGPTDAAGALIDATTRARARAAGLDPGAFLDRNDAYAFFDALGDLIRTGPTETNVGDLQVMLLS
jgi:glycerate-2-kinase